VRRQSTAARAYGRPRPPRRCPYCLWHRTARELLRRRRWRRLRPWDAGAPVTHLVKLRDVTYVHGLMHNGVAWVYACHTCAGYVLAHNAKIGARPAAYRFRRVQGGG
jgi:hypothetical protein